MFLKHRCSVEKLYIIQLKKFIIDFKQISLIKDICAFQEQKSTKVQRKYILNLCGFILLIITLLISEEKDLFFIFLARIQCITLLTRLIFGDP